MGLNRDKFKNIVGGITTPPVKPDEESPMRPEAQPMAGQGPVSERVEATEVPPGESRRFAQRGRPKIRKDELPAAKGKKVKVSLYLSETLVNDLYDWAHADRVHPGEMFDRALRAFHDKEAKRRNAGKG